MNSEHPKVLDLGLVPPAWTSPCTPCTFHANSVKAIPLDSRDTSNSTYPYIYPCFESTGNSQVVGKDEKTRQAAGGHAVPPAQHCTSSSERGWSVSFCAALLPKRSFFRHSEILSSPKKWRDSDPHMGQTIGFLRHRPVQTTRCGALLRSSFPPQNKPLGSGWTLLSLTI